MKTTNVDIDRQIKALERKKALIQALEAKREEINRQMQAIVGGATKVSGVSISRRERMYPRGVLTSAIWESLKGSKSGMSVDEIVNQLKKHKEFRDDDELTYRVRNVCNTSDRFETTGRGVYKNADSKLEGALFERLATA